MKKILFISLLVPLFAISSNAYAQSSASVNIQNHVNANSSNSNSNVSSHTNVTVETNGKVTHYESDTPNENVSVEAVNGDSTIKVNGSAVTGTPTENISKEPTIKPTGIEKMMNEQEKKEQNFLEEFKEKILAFRLKLFSIFSKSEK